MTKKQGKESRTGLSVRAKPEDLEKFRSAAEADYMTLSAWVLRTLHREADKTLSEPRNVRNVLQRLVDAGLADNDPELLEFSQQLGIKKRTHSDGA